jgi:hypothetical protein
MPSFTRLARLVTLPETRRLMGRGSRILARRGMRPMTSDERQALIELLRNPTRTVRLAREATGHPAARELASVGMVFLPVRYYLPAAWAVRRFLPKSRAVDASASAPVRAAGRPAARWRPW